ncbi:hypothetical protein DOTSEDRAFT_25444 [Dothistroma septosporum NZE10]|uniref:Uncharacterized protein n=1 Tax=Dothistroma septosporum (strain NZE10 / CBS 128990) TaxID=675120 RepID=M2Y5J3_DOTSN|nr:hypothetical protein DOTSEDRAFT_25444 [Dothistroma septosporum NZE10]
MPLNHDVLSSVDEKLVTAVRAAFSHQALRRTASLNPSIAKFLQEQEGTWGLHRPRAALLVEYGDVTKRPARRPTMSLMSFRELSSGLSNSIIEETRNRDMRDTAPQL